MHWVISPALSWRFDISRLKFIDWPDISVSIFFTRVKPTILKKPCKCSIHFCQSKSHLYFVSHSTRRLALRKDFPNGLHLQAPTIGEKVASTMACSETVAEEIILFYLKIAVLHLPCVEILDVHAMRIPATSRWSPHDEFTCSPSFCHLCVPLNGYS